MSTLTLTHPPFSLCAPLSGEGIASRVSYAGQIELNIAGHVPGACRSSGQALFYCSEPSGSLGAAVRVTRWPCGPFGWSVSGSCWWQGDAQQARRSCQPDPGSGLPCRSPTPGVAASCTNPAASILTNPLVAARNRPRSCVSRMALAGTSSGKVACAFPPG